MFPSQAFIPAPLDPVNNPKRELIGGIFNEE